MATIFINPNSATNGVGSLIDPKNVWPTSGAFVPGNTYLQMEGTTAVGTVTCNVDSSAAPPMVFGTYEPLTGRQLTGTSRRAAINGNGGDRGLFLQEAAKNIIVDSLEVHNAKLRGIHKDTTGQSVSLYAGVTIRNCDVHDVRFADQATPTQAINMCGSGNVIEDCVIHDLDRSGIIPVATGIVIRRNKIYNVGQYWLVDCIQLIDCVDALVYDNDLSKTTNNDKACIMIQAGSGNRIIANKIYVYGDGVINDGGGGIVGINAQGANSLIAANDVVHHGGIAIAVSGTGDGSMVRGNRITELRAAAQAGMSCIGISISRPNVTARHNTIYAPNRLPGAAAGDMRGFSMSSGASAGIKVDHNAVIGWRYGLLRFGANGSYTTYGRNAFWQCDSNIVDVSFNSQAAGPNDIASDPKLAGSLRPYIDSPLFTSGDPTLWARDGDDKIVNATIGAYGLGRVRAVRPTWA